jgi:hypothetical protein
MVADITPDGFIENIPEPYPNPHVLCELMYAKTLNKPIILLYHKNSYDPDKLPIFVKNQQYHLHKH